MLPDLRVMSKATLKKSLLSYFAIGWTGYALPVCRHTEIHIPEKYAPWLWGWANRFLNRISGFDTLEDIKRLPTNYSGGIWTNRMDRIGPLYKNH